VAKSSSDAESKKPARLSDFPGAMLCDGQREKPVGGSYDCKQVLGIVTKGGISIKCRRCKTITYWTWKNLKELSVAAQQQGESKKSLRKQTK